MLKRSHHLVRKVHLKALQLLMTVTDSSPTHELPLSLKHFLLRPPAQPELCLLVVRHVSDAIFSEQLFVILSSHSNLPIAHVVRLFVADEFVVLPQDLDVALAHCWLVHIPAETRTSAHERLQAHEEIDKKTYGPCSGTKHTRIVLMMQANGVALVPGPEHTCIVLLSVSIPSGDKRLSRRIWTSLLPTAGLCTECRPSKKWDQAQFGSSSKFCTESRPPCGVESCSVLFAFQICIMVRLI